MTDCGPERQMVQYRQIQQEGEKGVETGKQEILPIIEKTGAYARGHYLMRNGKHTDALLECSHLTENVETAEKLCDALMELCRDCHANLVLGTASGGLIFGYGVAKRLGLPFQYGERRNEGMQLRRGFRIPEGARVLLVEDIVSTGATVQQMMHIAGLFGAEVVEVVTVVDRTRGRLHLRVPMKSLIQVEANVYAPSRCPLCQKGIPMSSFAMDVRRNGRENEQA